VKRAHIGGRAKRDIAGRLRRGQTVPGEFVGRVLRIEEGIGHPEIGGDDAIAFLDRRAVEEERRPPLAHSFLSGFMVFLSVYFFLGKLVAL